MFRLVLALTVLFSFAIQLNNGSCVDPDGTAGRCSQSTIDGGSTIDPNGTSAVNTDKGLGVDLNG